MASFSLGRASAVLASGTLVSRILGFVLALVTTNTIGVFGSGADAFAIANQLPNTVYSVIAGGALNAVLVPQIVRSALHADGGARYINRLITLAFSLLLVVTVAAFLLAPVLVLLYGAQLDDDTFRLAIAFAYWCLPQVFFYGLYTILGEVLNARGSFGPFTWAPVMNNVIAISGMVTFGAVFGADPQVYAHPEVWTPAMIAVIGGTATLGVATQALVLTLFWRRVGLSYRPDFRIRGVGLGRAGTIALWSFAALLLTLVAGAIESTVASGASRSGPSVAALKTAWLIFMLPHSVVAVSIATAYFTKMSGHAARGETEDFRRDVSGSIRTVAMILVFATVALIVVGRPFASVFTDEWSEINAVAGLIIAYVVALPLFSTLAIVQRAFYALDDGRTPFFFTLVQAILVSLGCGLALFVPSSQTAFVIAGATALSIIVQSLLACVQLRLKLGGRGGRTVTVRFLQYSAATIPAIVVGVLILFGVGGTTDGGYATSGLVPAIVSMIAIGVPMAAVYFGTLWLMRVPELRAFAAPILRRIAR